jgi:hypothetical protein
MLVGCEYEARAPEMIGQILPSAHSVHDSVIVTVKGGEKSTLMEDGLISNEDFASALIESLRKSGLFKSVAASGDAAFRLETTIEDLAQPIEGFTITVDLEADWRLIRMSDNRAVWHVKISSTNTKR